MTKDWEELTDEQLAQLWVEDSRANRREGEGVSALMDLPSSAPERAWKVVLEILERLTDEEELLIANVGAGALEDLLNYHGADYIDRVIDCCRRDRRFRAAASCVWRSGIDAEIWLRLQAIVQSAAPMNKVFAKAGQALSRKR